MAASLDPHCDVLLVGDSIAMVLYGEPSTLQADMEMMIRHGRAVQNSSSKALVVIDMPFGSYQESKEQAFRNAARILKETGASSVKIEGGAEMAETIAYLAERAIPVMGHVGLKPQSVNTMGGFKTQGMDEQSAQKILTDAKSVADTGAYAIVLEGVAEKLAAEITQAVSCPVIGIGASAKCDGQILVAEDMLGISGGKLPRFVKNYAGIGAIIDQAAKTYAEEVRARKFPDDRYVYERVTDRPQTVAQPANVPGLEAQTPAPVPEPIQQQGALLAALAQDEIKLETPPVKATAPVLQARAAPSQENKPLSVFEGVLRATKRRDQ
jgi:3-methyl-2-oxobutanoate hydroxymethyltransferase